MKKIKNILPHFILILSAIILTFLILDDYNPTMAFLTNAISLKLLAGFCVLSILNAVWQMVEHRKH